MDARAQVMPHGPRASLDGWEEAFGSVAVEPHLMSSVTAGAGLDLARVEIVSQFAFPDGDSTLARLALLLGAEAEAEGLGSGLGQLYAEGLMQAHAVHLLRRYTASPADMDVVRGGLTPVRLVRVTAFARAHLAEPLALDDLAGAAGLSPFHFARAFRQTTGQTPFAFVRALRMDEAAWLLRERSHWSVVVALAVGYQSPTSFAAAFKGHWGATPSAYRRDRVR